MAVVAQVVLLALSLSCICAVSVYDNVENFIQSKPEDSGVHWAVLVAGSAGYDNYRHQADVCHAYQILKRHGLPDERIVVMMYDDIAHNSDNPTKGIIINHPNGSDVYHGVPKDYTNSDVTPANFLNILEGKDMHGIGSGKVIKSGPNDHVFVNFVDHGAQGIVGFPSQVLHARQWIQSLQNMHQANKYKQIVIYLEACESGSMFRNLLPKNINVYVTTASNYKESSFACYFDKVRGTYLGDVYSVKWMEDSDREKLNLETLHKQYKVVKQETNTSHVKQFGDLTISKEVLGEFQGKKKAEPIILPKAPLDAVPSQDVPLAIATYKLKMARGLSAIAKAQQEVKDIYMMRHSIEDKLRSVVSQVTTSVMLQDQVLNRRDDLADFEQFDCYEAAVDHFNRYCYNIAKYNYAMHKMYILANLCQKFDATSNILKSIHNVCVPQ